MMTDEPTTKDQAPDMMAALMEAFRRKEWGDHTVLTVAATFSDEDGNFEVALLDERGQPVWEPTRCNINDPATEFDEVMNEVCDFYQEWQANRYGEFGEWKTAP